MNKLVEDIEFALDLEDANTTASAHLDAVEVMCEPGHFDEAEVQVWRDHYAVMLSIEAETSDGGPGDRFGMLLELSETDVDGLIAALRPFSSEQFPPESE
jgi:hypothetical protein